MEINIYIVAGIIAFLFGSGIAFFVGHDSWHNPPRRSFALLTQLAALWCLFPLAASFNYGGETNLLFVRLLYIPGVLVPPFILQFIFDVTEDHQPSLKKLILGLAYFVSICFLFFVFHPQFIVGIKKYASLTAFVPGRIFHIFAAQYILIGLISFFLLIQNLRRIESKNRTKLQYVALALTIGIFSPLFHFSSAYFKWEPFPHDFFFIIYSSIIAYAIVRHRLLDIRLVVKKTIFYSISVFTVSAIYVILIFMIHHLFFAGKIERSGFAGSIALIFLIALTLKPLEGAVRKFLDRRFFHGTISEISEQKEKLVSELERQERLKSVGVLAAGMAHEIKNPLTSIRTFAEYLPAKHNDPVFRDQFSKIVCQETDRIHNLIKDLLLFSKPSEPRPEETLINKIIEDIVSLLSGDFLKYSIQTNLDLDPSAKVYADRDQVKQALLNVILNAVDAMKKSGGRLTIQTRVKKGRTEIAVQDTGIGIPKDKLPHLFDPFFTDKESGTGLGLAVTHSIIEKNKGKIWVESEDGLGAKFFVSLPRP